MINKGLPNIKINLGRSSAQVRTPLSMVAAGLQCGELKKIVLRKGEFGDHSAEAGFQFCDDYGKNKFIGFRVGKNCVNTYSKLSLAARALGIDIDPMTIRDLPPGQHHLTPRGIKTTKLERYGKGRRSRR